MYGQTPYHLLSVEDLGCSGITEEWTSRDNDAADAVTKAVNEYTSVFDLQEMVDCGLFESIAAEHDANFHHLEQFISDTVSERMARLKEREAV